jgi:hypothetical protein
MFSGLGGERQPSMRNTSYITSIANLLTPNWRPVTVYFQVPR